MTNLLSRITIDPQIAHGKPVLRGLRYHPGSAAGPPLDIARRACYTSDRVV